MCIRDRIQGFKLLLCGKKASRRVGAAFDGRFYFIVYFYVDWFVCHIAFPLCVSSACLDRFHLLIVPDFRPFNPNISIIYILQKKRKF